MGVLVGSQVRWRAWPPGVWVTLGCGDICEGRVRPGGFGDWRSEWYRPAAVPPPRVVGVGEGKEAAGPQKVDWPRVMIRGSSGGNVRELLRPVGWFYQLCPSPNLKGPFPAPLPAPTCTKSPLEGGAGSEGQL